MLKAVIFDFDGVITDSEILHLRSFNRVLAQYGIEITTKAYYKDYLGLTDFECFKLVADERQLGLDDQQIANLMKQKTKIFEQLAETEGRIIEGVHDFLKMLEQNNIPMAICSGAVQAEIELILEQARLRHFFAAIVSADQIKKGKPHPEGFLLTLQRLNRIVSPAQAGIQNPILREQCIVIEDSRWGLEAAKAAGMHTIAVTNSYDADQLTLAEKIVTQLTELSIRDLQQLCT
ncbi:MAG: HAD family hydrolase [Planctomycetota bacterium]|jgi:beta-phosphoglucomutase